MTTTENTPLRKPAHTPPPITALNIDGLDHPDMMRRLSARFGDGPLVLATFSDPLTARHCHCTIHVLDLVDNFMGPLIANCHAPLRHAVGVLAEPAGRSLTDWLTGEMNRFGLQPCRLCPACVPAFDHPDHDPHTCASTHQLPTRIAAELSAAAVAVIAGLVAAPEERVNVETINPSAEVWAEIRRAFPVESFRAWVQGNDGAAPDDER